MVHQLRQRGLLNNAAGSGRDRQRGAQPRMPVVESRIKANAPTNPESRLNSTVSDLEVAS